MYFLNSRLELVEYWTNFLCGWIACLVAWCSCYCLLQKFVSNVTTLLKCNATCNGSFKWTNEKKKKTFYKNFIARFKLLTSMFKTIKSNRNGKVCSASSRFQGHFKNKIEVNNKRKKKKKKPQQQQKWQTQLLTHSHMMLWIKYMCIDSTVSKWTSDRARKHLLQRFNACVCHSMWY